MQVNEKRPSDYARGVAELARTAYGLAVDALPGPFPGAHQRRHRKLIVEAAERRFLAKTYPDDPVTRDALAFQHRLAAHLRSQGLPAPEVLPAKDGRRIVQAGGWLLELQALIEGEPMQVRPATLRAAAEALRRFHACCRGFPAPPRDARRWRFSEAPSGPFARLYQAARREDGGQADDHCDTVARFLQTAAQALSPEERARFETGLIHGDWHGGNLLFQGDRLVGVVDLEFAGDGCYLEDLAYALSNLCVRTAEDEARLDARTHLFLKTYTAERLLSYYEEHALYYAVGIKHIATVTCQLPQMGGKLAGLGPAPWLQRLAAQCSWLEQRARTVRRAF